MLLPPANYVEFYKEVAKIVKDTKLASYEVRGMILKLVDNFNKAS